MLDSLYGLIDILLPFQWVQYDFMKNALIAVLLVTPLFGILGTMVVNNKMAFFADSLGHGAFTGIAIGIGFISTPFDLESIDFLETFNMDFWKVPCNF